MVFEQRLTIMIYFPQIVPDSKVHGANMGPTWVLSAPDGPYVYTMNLADRGVIYSNEKLMKYQGWRYLYSGMMTHVSDWIKES